MQGAVADVDESSRADADESSCGRLSLAANRLYFSRAWSMFYVFMLVISFVGMVVLVTAHATSQFQKEDPYFIAVEILLNITLALELGVRMAAQQERFFRDACNIFDLCIMLVCIVTLIVFLEAPVTEMGTAVIGSSILGTRYAVVTIRMIYLSYLIRQRKAEVGSCKLDVDFNLLQDGREHNHGATSSRTDSRSHRSSRADSFGSNF